MSLAEGEEDQINQSACCGKDEGDGSSRVHRTDDMGNQYEGDYQRLKEFTDTTINQIDP